MINKVIVVGRLVDQPKEVKGGAIGTIASSEVYNTKGGEKKEATSFIPIYVGEHFKGVMPYLEKGKLVGIVGKIRSYKNKDGNSQIIVNVDELDLLSNGHKEEKAKPSKTAKPTKKSEDEEENPPWA
jgi:single-stranded DNA-binding protein